MRAISHLSRVTVRSISNDGVTTSIRKIVKHAFGGHILQLISGKPIKAPEPPPIKYPQTRLDDAGQFARNVLIVAELSIPQCKSYRVDIKARQLHALGFEVTVTRWQDFWSARTALQYASAVIFYRAPLYPEVGKLIAEARRLGVRSFWEVDDLIFDDVYAENSNLRDLSSEEREVLLEGARLYRKALIACDEGIGSTSAIAAFMERATGRPAHVVENALDDAVLRVARKKLPKASARDGLIRIVYGSGTRTHDTDFLEAAEGIARLLRRFPNVRFRLIGELRLPAIFDDLAHAVERRPLLPFDDYLALVAECDIAIAPLEPSVFNDAKSNIKFLEASALGLPSVASPGQTFRDVIENGKTGFLATTPEEWEQALHKLVVDPVLRQQMASRAATYVTERYDMASLARRQLDFLKPNLPEIPYRRRLLVVNIFYAPLKYGGATVVAEEICNRMLAFGWEIFVFTSWGAHHVAPFATMRYRHEGQTVFAIKLPDNAGELGVYGHTRLDAVFRAVLRACAPEAVHFHCIQEMGVSLVDVCVREQTPYFITLHDAWWLCERQFMVDGNARFCGQVTIDLNACAICTGRLAANETRRERMQAALRGARGLFAPSAYFRNLYLANGAPGEKLYLNRNGVTPPGPKWTPRHDPSCVRFGFIGGEQPIKGSHLVKAVFTSLRRKDFHLVLADPLVNLGATSVNKLAWGPVNQVTVLPAYTMETIDAFFARFDVLLFPTQWKESFGLTVREALARGLWVIATNAGGVTEDLIDGVNGDIIPLSDDPSWLREAVLKLLDAPAFREHAVARQRSNRVRSFDEQARELNHMLLTLLDDDMPASQTPGVSHPE